MSVSDELSAASRAALAACLDRAARLNQAMLASPCDIVWRVDGVPNDVKVEGNVLSGLCLIAHCSESAGWGLSFNELLSIPDGGQVVIEGDGPGLISDHLAYLDRVFGSSVPLPGDQPSVLVLKDLLVRQFKQEVLASCGTTSGPDKEVFALAMARATRDAGEKILAELVG